MKKLLLITFAIVFAVPASAQVYSSGSGGYWKQHRKEFFGGFGGALYRGDLGGLSNDVVDNFLAGQEFSILRPAAHVGLRYFLSSNFSLRGNLSYARLYGSDENAEAVYRRNRNLNFRTNVFEASLMAEIHLTKEKVLHRHGLRGARGKAGLSLGTYLFAGFGAFYFDPQGFYDIPGVGSGWAFLQPLGTEGQLLPDGDGKYSRIAYSIPVGIGIKKSFTRNISIGVELSYRFTTTDYIDDVSTNYANTEAIAAISGPVAAYLADPSLGANLTPLELELLGFPGRPGWTAEGQQRGNPEGNDAFMMATVTLTYRIFQSSKSFNKRGSKAARKSAKRLVF
jgi:hypothetical protein